MLFPLLLSAAASLHAANGPAVPAAAPSDSLRFAASAPRADVATLDSDHALPSAATAGPRSSNWAKRYGSDAPASMPSSS